MYKTEVKPDQLKQIKDHPRKLIRIRSVIELTGLSKSYIYDLCNRGLFPRKIRLVPGGSSVAWVESEVADFIANRIHARDVGVSI